MIKNYKIIRTLFTFFIFINILTFLCVKQVKAIGQITYPYVIGNHTYVQDKFTINQQGYSYTDALYFSKEEYDQLSVSDIEAMEQSRFDNWLTYIRPSPQSDPISVPEFGLMPGIVAFAVSVFGYLKLRNKYIIN